MPIDSRHRPFGDRSVSIGRGERLITQVPDRAVNELRRLAQEYLEATREFFPKPDAWKQLDRDGVWKRFVYQVVVVGNSSAEDRLQKSSQAQQELNFDHLVRLEVEQRRMTIHRNLRGHGVRYAAGDLQECRKTSALMRNCTFLSAFRGGPPGYLKFLDSIAKEESRVRHVIEDMCYIKQKGARDLLAELDLVRNVVALDTRLITILQRLGVTTSPNLQTNPSRYAALERELIERVCAPLGITGVQLDRILYRNYEAIKADPSACRGQGR